MKHNRAVLLSVVVTVLVSIGVIAWSNSYARDSPTTVAETAPNVDQVGTADSVSGDPARTWRDDDDDDDWDDDDDQEHHDSDDDHDDHDGHEQRDTRHHDDDD